MLGPIALGIIFGLAYGLYRWFAKGEDSIQFLTNLFSVARLIVTSFNVFALCICGLLGLLTGGLSRELIAEKNLTRPNQGIRRSLLYSLCIGSIGLIFGSILGGAVGGWHQSNLLVTFAYALIIGPLIGLMSALRAGGSAYIQHTLLHRLLRKEGVAPRDYAHFLDYAVERVFLQKVGGGYMFVHRLLLEYFASLPGNH